MRNNIVYEIISEIGYRWHRLSRAGKRAIAGTLAAMTVVGAGHVITKNDKKDIYLVDLKDKYQDDAVLLDDNGKEIEITTVDRDNLLAIVDTRKTKKGEMYSVILVDDNGILSKGYMDGKYLNNKAEDKIKIPDTDSISIKDLDRYNVSANKGAYMRNNKKVDQNTNKAKLLEKGEKVISTGITETSRKNDFDWLKVIRYDSEEKELSEGYMVSDYLMNDNYKLANGKRFIIKNTPEGILRIRSSAEIPEMNDRGNVLVTLKEGTEVILVPEFSSISDDNYDWFYVACQINGEWIYGYMAATEYTNNDVRNYLEEVITETDEVGQIRSFTTMLVDTSKAKGIDLKLRKEPSTDSDIISKIENGTDIYVYEDSLDNPVENGRFKWVEVKLLNGEVGYVAMTYLVDKENVESRESDEIDNTQTISSEGPITVNFNGEEREGYVGIDVNNNINSNKFIKLISSNHNYAFNVKVKRKNSNGGSIINPYYINSIDKNNDEIPDPIVVNQIPDFVFLKIGATIEKGEFKISEKNDTYIDEVAKRASACEKYSVPYGFYYFCQATTEEEVEKEVKEIKRLYSQVGTSEYNVLPLMLDFENFGKTARILESANRNGKSYQTDIINKTMNRVREELNVPVILYTDHNTLNSTFNFSELDEINKNNCYIVEVSKTHISDLSDEVLRESAFSQVLVDTCVGSPDKNGVVDTISPDFDLDLDIDFVDKEAYEKYTKKLTR